MKSDFNYFIDEYNQYVKYIITKCQNIISITVIYRGQLVRNILEQLV